MCSIWFYFNQKRNFNFFSQASKQHSMQKLTSSSFTVLKRFENGAAAFFLVSKWQFDA